MVGGRGAQECVCVCVRVCVLAGNGVCGLLDGPASRSQLCAPMFATMSSTGVLYVSDTNNNVLRAIFNNTITVSIARDIDNLTQHHSIHEG